MWTVSRPTHAALGAGLRKAALTLAFWPRHPAEMDFLKAHLAEIHFTERSSLARIGIEMHLEGPPTIE